MKKSFAAPKLSLHKETIRALTGDQLTPIVGAACTDGHLCVSVKGRLPCCFTEDGNC